MNTITRTIDAAGNTWTRRRPRGRRAPFVLREFRSGKSRTWLLYCMESPHTKDDASGAIADSWWTRVSGTGSTADYERIAALSPARQA